MPHALRGDSSDTIFGLPNLNKADQARVVLGNKQVRWVCKLIQAAIHHGTPFVLENPQTSRIWLVPCLADLIKKSTSDIVFHHCAFGASWKKPTRLVGWNLHLEHLAKTCKSNDGVCCFSGLPHIILSGKGPSCFKTAKASAYPFKFCKVFGATIKGLNVT